MRYVGITRSKCHHVVKKILFWESPNNIAFLISFLIQKGKMGDAFYPKLIKLLFPLCIVDIQHDKVDTVPGKNALGT